MDLTHAFIVCLIAIAEQFYFVPLCLFVLKDVPNGELFALIYHKQRNSQQKEERNVKKEKENQYYAKYKPDQKA